MYFDQVEKLLIEQNRLREQKRLQEESLALKEKELQLLQRMSPAQSKVTAVFLLKYTVYILIITANQAELRMKGN